MFSQEFEEVLIRFCDYVAEKTPNFRNLPQRDQFGTCAYQFMHFQTRRSIAVLSKEDLTTLEEDLSKWIASCALCNGPMAMDTYGLPGHDFSSAAEPEDLTDEHRLAEMHEMNMDEFRDSGVKIYGAVFEMVKKEIANSNEEYFRKFHNLICFMECQDIKECVKKRAEMNKEYGVLVF